MQTSTMAALALGFLAPAQATDFDKVQILDRINQLGVTQQQIQPLHQAAQHIRQARTAHEQGLAQQAANEAHMSRLLEALAAGRALTQEERDALRHAQEQRRRLDQELETQIGQAVNHVINALNDDQKFRLAVSEQARRQAAETVAQLQRANDAEFQRLSRGLSMQVLRPELEQMRNQFRPAPGESAGTAQDRLRQMREQMQQRRQQQGNQRGQRGQRQQGSINDQTRQQAQQFRQQMQEMQRVAQERLNRVRQGDQNMARDLERTLAMNRMGRGEADRRMRQEILAIIGQDASVAAIEQRMR